MKWLSGFLAAVVIVVVACSDAFKPTVENVSGDYRLQSFTTDSAGIHKDWVAAGATLELLLSPLGEVIGHLNMQIDTTIFFADMLGTWELSGNTIHFTQNADSFVRDMDWIVAKDGLSADETFGVVRVRIALARQPAPY